MNKNIQIKFIVLKFMPIKDISLFKNLGLQKKHFDSSQNQTNKN